MLIGLRRLMLTSIIFLIQKLSKDFQWMVDGTPKLPSGRYTVHKAESGTKQYFLFTSQFSDFQLNIFILDKNTVIIS